MVHVFADYEDQSKREADMCFSFEQVGVDLWQDGTQTNGGRGSAVHIKDVDLRFNGFTRSTSQGHLECEIWTPCC
jgi:hypothetical protein